MGGWVDFEEWLAYKIQLHGTECIVSLFADWDQSPPTPTPPKKGKHFFPLKNFQVEQERLRQEAIKQAEKERRDKYKKQEEEREVLRQGIRDKVSIDARIEEVRGGWGELRGTYCTPINIWINLN